MSLWENRRNRRKFTDEFKRDAAKLVGTSGKPIAVIARDLGIYGSMLGNWVKQDRIDQGEREGLTTAERTRLAKLEAENASCGWSVTCSNDHRLLGEGNVDAVSRYRPCR